MKSVTNKPENVIDINLPNAPVSETHPMNSGNKRNNSNNNLMGLKEKSFEKVSSSLVQKASKPSSRSSKSQSNKRSKEFDAIKELNDLADSNSLGDDSTPVSHNTMNIMDEKFNSDLYDTN